MYSIIVITCQLRHKEGVMWTVKPDPGDRCKRSPVQAGETRMVILGYSGRGSFPIPSGAAFYEACYWQAVEEGDDNADRFGELKFFNGIGIEIQSIRLFRD
jgi:hypothetical protein